jgi:hypothetical protein
VYIIEYRFKTASGTTTEWQRSRNFSSHGVFTNLYEAEKEACEQQHFMGGTYEYRAALVPEPSQLSQLEVDVLKSKLKRIRAILEE